ncbi:MAG: ATPase, T2SS/T4P/T4SS family [Thermodesulfovibrionales bacterium]|nr:ATPase, T2SS/T4P/T4SS family [Thermodesulfovibrionales bacterium]
MAKYADLFKIPSLNEPSATQKDKEQKTERFTLLLVDDEENVLNALKRVFADENYEILTARSGMEALKIISNRTIHLVISDHRMPNMTGAELLREIRTRQPETIRIMLTGHADIQAVMGAINEGAVYKFITKPWNDDDLRITVSLALQQYLLLLENKRLKDIAQQQNIKLKNYSNLFDTYRGILGSILVKQNIITNEQLQEAQRLKLPEEFIAETLIRLRLVSEDKIVQVLQKTQGFDFIDIKEVQINPNIVRLLPQELCKKHKILPIKLEGKNLTIAMADPTDVIMNDNISMLTGFNVIPVIARLSDINTHIKKTYESTDTMIKTLTGDTSTDFEPIEDIDVVIEEDETDTKVQDLLDSSGVPPIIRIVNSIILEALRYNASDIHIEPKTKYTLVRYRIDGILHSKIKVPTHIHPAVISRIKILAKLDIAERRRPQDGRITIKTGTKIVDVRVSTMPTINGEKVTMRVLDKSASVKRLNDIGLLQEDLEKLELLINKPQGIIISTGPTGSGKTTMLYSILYHMLKPTKNFETIEDPVEYFLEDANQVHIKEATGLTFPMVLRATLRQDPDVILVGEIRDFETADVAFKAALTGHMVLTSLHTNNTVASITRLIDMGIKPFLISSAVEGIIAQRLVRRVCNYCKTTTKPDIQVLKLLRLPLDSISEVSVGEGCSRCNGTGYSGRTGVFEVFVMNEEFRHLISYNYREAEIFSLAKLGGMKTLMEDAFIKVKMGITTLDEVLRVIGTQTKPERRCDGCNRMIDIMFNFCPYCGAFRQNICKGCKSPLEEDWFVCPFCGQKVR